MWLYVLELKYNKFYVGKTICVDSRFKAHENGNGCPWTREYPPIRISEKYEIQDNGFEEDCKVKELMKIHGIENVRGGSYSSINISKFAMKLLMREIRHASDECFTCGSTSHFAANCPKRKQKKISLECPICDNFAINCECNLITLDIKVPIKMTRTRGNKRKTEYQKFFDRNYKMVADMINSTNMIVINKKIAELWKYEKSKLLLQ